jgi:hypothetical protein
MLRLQSGFDDLGVVGDASISTRKGAKMKNIVAWSSQKEATKVWVHDGGEYSHRLITKERHGSSFSFHITTFLPNFETEVEGDGVHEVVLFCLHGWSTQTILPSGETHLFTPGEIMYLPVNYRYRHVIGDAGLVVAVACNPSAPG